MGTLFVDKLDPQSGTSLEIGSSGDTISVPSGCYITNVLVVNLDVTGATGAGLYYRIQVEHQFLCIHNQNSELKQYLILHGQLLFNLIMKCLQDDFDPAYDQFDTNYRFTPSN